MDTTIKYVTKNFIEFGVLFDLDLAIAQYILLNTKNTNFIDKSIRESKVEITNNYLKNKLLYRKYDNPLSAVLDNKYKDSFDDILESIMKDHADDVYERIIPTDLLQAINAMGVADDIIKSRIKCDNEKQVNIVEKYSKVLETVRTNELFEDSTSLFIKYLNNIQDYAPIGGKYIYIVKGNYNLGPNFLPSPVVTILGEQNVIRMVDIYSNITIPEVNLEDYINEHSKN